MTALSESFNKADSDTLGPDLAWTESSGDWDVKSNTASLTTAGTHTLARCNTALAGADNYAQLDIVKANSDGTSQIRAVCRMDPASTGVGDLTGYAVIWQADFGGATVSVYGEWFVGGTNSNFTVNHFPLALPATIKIWADGTRIHIYYNGVEIDTVIDTHVSGFTSVGFLGLNATADDLRVDSFAAGDLVSGGPDSGEASLFKSWPPPLSMLKTLPSIGRFTPFVPPPNPPNPDAPPTVALPLVSIADGKQTRPAPVRPRSEVITPRFVPAMPELPGPAVFPAFTPRATRRPPLWLTAQSVAPPALPIPGAACTEPGSVTVTRLGLTARHVAAVSDAGLVTGPQSVTITRLGPGSVTVRRKPC